MKNEIENGCMLEGYGPISSGGGSRRQMKVVVKKAMISATVNDHSC